MSLRELAARVAAFPAALKSEALPRVSETLMEVTRAEAAGALTIHHLELTALASVSGDSVTISPVPRGAWIFSEKGSYKSPDGWEIKRRRDGGALLLPDGGFVISLTHPGISGDDTWSNTREAMSDVLPDTITEIGAPLWERTVSG